MSSGLAQISVFVVGYAALVVVAALFVAFTRRERPPWLDSMVWLLEVLNVIRAVAGVGSMLGGSRPAEMSAHIGYLVASVCILPIAMSSITEDRGVWCSGVIAVAAIAVGVIAVRLQMTWS